MTCSAAGRGGYQRHLRGLVISNMMASVPAYNGYAEQVLMPEMDQAALAEIKSLEASGQTGDPRYMELLAEQHYVHHVLRMPPGQWPDPVQRGFAHINPDSYVSMQGPSELGISASAKPAVIGLSEAGYRPQPGRRRSPRPSPWACRTLPGRSRRPRGAIAPPSTAWHARRHVPRSVPRP